MSDQENKNNVAIPNTMTATEVENRKLNSLLETCSSVLNTYIEASDLTLKENAELKAELKQLKSDVEISHPSNLKQYQSDQEMIAELKAKLALAVEALESQKVYLLESINNRPERNAPELQSLESVRVVLKQLDITVVMLENLK